MDPLGVVVGAVFVAAVLVLALTVGRRKIGPYFIGRDRALEQRATEIFMGGATDGYVPHPEFGPSPRERLKAAQPDDDD